MTGVLLAAAATALVGGTSLILAAMLQLHGLPRFLLAAYVLGFAEIVGLILVLSAFGAVTRGGILAVVATVFAAALAVWLHIGAPRQPLGPVGRLRELIRVPVLLVLVLVDGLALLYTFALIVGTPPNNGDSLAYHLARAAFWRQEGGVGYIAHAYDERLNIHPPNAELVLTFVLEMGRDERLAGFVQLVGVVALATGVFALARTLCFSRHEAAFGALLFLTLPVVLLQASTSQNDLVSASLLLAAMTFVVGQSRAELMLAGLATALAIGTKTPAVYAIPILCAAGLVARAPGQRGHAIIAIFIGAAVGSYWYAVNVVRDGHPLGDLADTTEGLVSFLQPADNVLAAYARILDAFDLSGSVGADLLLYPLVAAALTIVSLVGLRHAGPASSALLRGSLIVTPLYFIPLGYLAWRGFAKLHSVLDAPDLRLPVARYETQTMASESLSWFGPIGLLLVVGIGLATLALVRQGSLPPVAFLFVVAPLVWFVFLALSLGYDRSQGRFFIFPVALSAALWGLVLRARPYAVAAVAIATTTAALSLVHFVEKPSGIRLLESDVNASVWGLSRWQVQSVHQPETPRQALRFLNELPGNTTVALALGFNDFGYPAFGSGLERRVELVPIGSAARASEAEWLLANSRRAGEIDRDCWRPVDTMREGWVAFQRRKRARC